MLLILIVTPVLGVSLLLRTAEAARSRRAPRLQPGVARAVAVCQDLIRADAMAQRFVAPPSSGSRAVVPTAVAQPVRVPEHAL